MSDILECPAKLPVECASVDFLPVAPATDTARLAAWRVEAAAAHRAHGDRSPHWRVTTDAEGLINVRLWLARPCLVATSSEFTLFSRAEIAGLLPLHLACLRPDGTGRPDLAETWF